MKIIPRVIPDVTLDSVPRNNKPGSSSHLSRPKNYDNIRNVVVSIRYGIGLRPMAAIAALRDAGVINRKRKHIIDKNIVQRAQEKLMNDLDEEFILTFNIHFTPPTKAMKDASHAE